MIIQLLENLRAMLSQWRLTPENPSGKTYQQDNLQGRIQDFGRGGGGGGPGNC